MFTKSSFFVGGDEEDRTLDLTDANRTLSQLSYAPICLATFPSGKEHYTSSLIKVQVLFSTKRV